MDISIFWMVLTSLLWGTTDPLMKLYGSHTNFAKQACFSESRNSKPQRYWHSNLAGAISLFQNWRYVATFLTNQLGRYVAQHVKQAYEKNKNQVITESILNQ